VLEELDITVQANVNQIMGGDNFIESVESVLYSAPNSSIIQNPHSDLGEEMVGKSILAFAVVHPNTTMIAYPGSHNPGRRGRRNRFRPVRYRLNVGDIFYFHPRLIHCGDSYRQANVRVHYYLFTHRKTKWADITFPVRETEARQMLWAAGEQSRFEELGKARGDALSVRWRNRSVVREWMLALSEVRRGGTND